MSDDIKKQLINRILHQKGLQKNTDPNSNNSSETNKKIYTFELDLNSRMEQNELSSALAELKKSESLKAIKLALDEDPAKSDYNSFIFKHKGSLIPNAILKNIRDSEELIGGIILPLKANQVSLFGRPRPNRFDVGFTISIKPHAYEVYSDEEINKLKTEIVPILRNLILNCGKTSGVENKDRITFSQFLKQIVEDVLTYGWWTVEVRYDAFGNFHSFRAIDAGTIYHAVPNRNNNKQAESIRQKAREILSKLEGQHRIPIDDFVDGHYSWVQVIDNQPYQVFTDDQLLVWSLSPSTDITRFGYPVSPMERLLDSITMHINLTTHNKMFFVSGRAARSILVFKSDMLDKDDITNIRQQMTNHINSANASWRLPVFGLSPNDDITVVPLDGGSRDMEFTYLADLNKRMILAAFQVSPEEISALSYLSRGTVSQALAESNNEWKLLKSQQSGLRPLLNAIEDFINLQLLPKINPDWAKIFGVYLEGLDADTPEKEATLISQATSLYYSFNDILDRVEKPRVELAGDFPLNAAYLQILEKYFTMGEILETFQPDRYKGASKDPRFQFYLNNPAWFQYQSLIMQQQQMQMQQQQIQMQQQQMQQQGQAQQQGQVQDAVNDNQNNTDSGGDQNLQQQNTEANPQQESAAGQDQLGQSGELQQSEELQSSGSLDTALGQLNTLLNGLSKSEKALPANRKKLLLLYKKAKSKIIKDFEDHSDLMTKTLLDVIQGKKVHDHE